MSPFIIKRGLRLFKAHGIPLQLPISLPPVYASFVMNYQVGRAAPRVSEELLHPVYKEKVTVARPTYLTNPGEVSLGALFSIEESNEITDRLEDLRQVCSHGYRVIGEDATGHSMLLLGVGENNIDQIFIYSPDLTFRGGKKITFVATNIYSFINGFALITLEEGIGYNIDSYENLYKNWGEDFWRVRENDDTDMKTSDHD